MKGKIPLTHFTLYQDSRDTFKKFDTIYPLASFLTKPIKNTQDLIQFYPLSNSLIWLDYLRDKYGYPSVEDTYSMEARLYQSFPQGIQRLFENQYDEAFTLLQEGADFLDSVGNLDPNHTIRITELKDESNSLYYLFLAGLPAIEYKNQELAKNYPELNKAIIQQKPSNDSTQTIDENLLLILITRMIRHYFKREMTVEDIDLNHSTHLFYEYGPFVNTIEALVLEPDSDKPYQKRIGMMLKSTLTVD